MAGDNGEHNSASVQSDRDAIIGFNSDLLLPWQPNPIQLLHMFMCYYNIIIAQQYLWIKIQHGEDNDQEHSAKYR